LEEDEVEDSNDDDVGSWYDTVTFLAHLLDVRPLLEPISGGSTVEGEEEPAEGRAREGPLERGSATLGVP
jgi:hypothetical protein